MSRVGGVSRRGEAWHSEQGGRGWGGRGEPACVELLVHPRWRDGAPQCRPGRSPRGPWVGTVSALEGQQGGPEAAAQWARRRRRASEAPSSAGASGPQAPASAPGAEPGSSTGAADWWFQRCQPGGRGRRSARLAVCLWAAGSAAFGEAPWRPLQGAGSRPRKLGPKARCGSARTFTDGPLKACV